MLLPVAVSLIFAGLMLTAAVCDMLRMEIPNRISISLAVLYAPLALISGQDWRDVAMHYGIGLCVLALMFILFHFGLLGGGDGKLIAACSIWFGLDTPTFLLGMILSGGILALFVLVLRISRISLPLVWLQRLMRRGEGIPYALAVTAGALWAMQFLSVPTVFSVVAEKGGNLDSSWITVNQLLVYLL